MKYCAHCGKQLEDEQLVCNGCGCPVEKVEQVVAINGYDNTARVFGWISCFIWLIMPILSFIFGGIGLSRAKERNDSTARTLCMVGIIVPAVIFGLLILLYVIGIVILVTMQPLSIL